MLNRNSILLRRRNKVIVPRGDGSLHSSYIATINKNLESLGYTLSENVFEALGSLSSDDATRFYEELVAILTEARGVRDYKPMYPNFPRQVMEAPAAELYLNAVLHYLTAWVADVVGEGRSEIIWLPDYEKQPREPLKDSVRLTVIEVGTEDGSANQSPRSSNRTYTACSCSMPMPEAGWLKRRERRTRSSRWKRE